MVKYNHLLGLPFEHGRQDCYELARGFYKHNYGLELTPYARPDNWWDHGLNLYMDHFAAEGFESQDIPLKQLRVGDAILVAVRSEVANHVGIYVGQGKLIHHFYGRLSEECGLIGVFRRPLAIIRHKSIKAEEENVQVVDLMDMIPAHLRRRFDEAAS